MNKREYLLVLDSFYKYQKGILRFFGLWKLSATATTRYRLIHTIYFYFVLMGLVLSFDICCIIQVIVKISDLSEIIKVFFVFSSCLAMLSKFSNIKLNNHLYYELMEVTLRKPAFQPTNKREIQLLQNSKRLSRYLRIIYWGMSFFSLNAMFIPQSSEDSVELPMPVYSPINVDEKWGYVTMYLYQYVTVCAACHINVAFDTFACALLMHIKGLLDIICDRLESLGSAEEDESLSDSEMTIKLKNCIKFYDEIEDLARRVEGLVNVPISAQIVCSIMVLMANFYAMSFLSDEGDDVKFLKFAVYQLCMLNQIFILCYFCGEVTFKSEKISFYLYCSKWVEWSKYNRKLALLMMYRFDLPINMRSFVPTYTFNLAAFTSIVNTSYSYFTLLKRFNS